jgi:Lar family restriction alleviation protein
MTDTDLLPCPFCGGTAELVQWRDTLDPHATWIHCIDCDVMTESYHHEDAEQAKRLAAAVWNRRTGVDNAN